jgi:hypothetical protein
MPRSIKVKKQITTAIENAVKQKLWGAFVAQQTGKPTRVLTDKFDCFFKTNQSLRKLIIQLKEEFLRSKRTDHDLYTSFVDYLGKFEAVLFEYLGEISAIAHMDETDIDEAFALLTLNKVERINAVELAIAGTAATSQGYPINRNIQVYSSQERLLRRMDSLARLLSISSAASVCTAVTIYDGELYIGSNVSGEIPQADMVDTFGAKLCILKEFIQQIKEADLAMTDDALTDAIQYCVQRLIETGGSLGNESVLKQALFKFIDTVRARNSIDGHTSRNHFSSVEVDAILSPTRVTVLLPYGRTKKNRKSAESNCMGVHIRNASGNNITKYPFPEQLQHLVVKDFHAEQLIATYLTNEKGVDLEDTSAEKIRIGLTKLCCRTCFDTLSHFPRLELRGTHNVSYSNVANLFLATTCGQVSTPNIRDTVAKPSPGDTPFFDDASPSTILGRRRYKISSASPIAKINDFHKKAKTASSTSYLTALQNHSVLGELKAGTLNIETNEVVGTKKKPKAKSSQKPLRTNVSQLMGSPSGVAGSASFFSPEKPFNHKSQSIRGTKQGTSVVHTAQKRFSGER